MSRQTQKGTPLAPRRCHGDLSASGGDQEVDLPGEGETRGPAVGGCLEEEVPVPQWVWEAEQVE